MSKFGGAVPRSRRRMLVRASVRWKPKDNQRSAPMAPTLAGASTHAFGKEL